MTSRLLSRIEKLEAEEHLRASAPRYSADHMARSYVVRLLEAAKDGPEGKARFDALLRESRSIGEAMAEILRTHNMASLEDDETS